MEKKNFFLSCSSQRVTGHYPEPDEFTQRSYTIPSNLISISCPFYKICQYFQQKFSYHFSSPLYQLHLDNLITNFISRFLFFHFPLHHLQTFNFPNSDPIRIWKTTTPRTNKLQKIVISFFLSASQLIVCLYSQPFSGL